MSSAPSRRRSRLQPLCDQTMPDLDWQSLFVQLAEGDNRGMLLINPDRTVVAINPCGQEMLGYTGRLPAPVSEVVPDVDLRFAVGEALHDRQPGWHDTYLPEPNRLLRFHLVPILDREGRPVLVVASADDITRLRHLETVRRDFVANVSHELRTPIASIRLLVETLQSGALDDREAALHFLHRIEVETQSMQQLVEELLELSRLESGRMALEIEPVSMQEILASVASRLAPSARAKDIEMRLDVQDSLPPVRADGRRIEQVLMNLTHNAIKFTPDRGTVTLRARQQGPGIEVEVVDTGIGMSPGDVRRVFERFYKADKGRDRSTGSGLGLAIVRHLLELHGSQLRVVSEEGRGSRFSFALPIAG